MNQHENSWPFRKPVDTKKVRDYLEVIKTPMDLETILKKVEARKNPTDPEVVPYSAMEQFRQDIHTMFENARVYN